MQRSLDRIKGWRGRRLLSLEARIVDRDALSRVERGLHRISALLVRFAIQELRSFAFVSGVVRAEYEPTRERRMIVERNVIVGGPRRDHQIPAHKRKRGGVAEIHMGVVEHQAPKTANPR